MIFLFFFLLPHKESQLLCVAFQWADSTHDGQWQRTVIPVLSNGGKGGGTGEEYVKKLPIFSIFFCAHQRKFRNQREK